MSDDAAMSGKVPDPEGERDRDPWAPPAPAVEQPSSGPTPTVVPTPYPYPGAGAPAAGPAPVPPPPVAPGGPGHVPYGYPAPYGGPMQPGYGGAGAGHPGPGGYGAYPGYGWPGVPAPPSNGMGTAAMVLGIVSVIGFCAWPIAVVGGVLAVVFGVMGMGKARRGEATNRGQALAGVICGGVGAVLGVAFIVLLLALPSVYKDESPDLGDDDGFNTSLVLPDLR